MKNSTEVPNTIFILINRTEIQNHTYYVRVCVKGPVYNILKYI